MTVLHRPAVLLWLGAVVALALKWAGPLDTLYDRATLADLLIAAAVAFRALELVRGRGLELRGWHPWLAAYVALAGVSAAVAPDGGTAARNLLIVTELALFAALTADLARDAAVRVALGWAVLSSIGVTLVLAVTGLALFYAGESTSLIGAFGEQYEPSESYGRIAAGFETPPLLASWCLVASAIVAWPAARVAPRLRVLAQFVLGLLVFATLSRAALAFVAGLTIRWAAGAPTRGRVTVAVTVVAGVVLVFAALTAGRLHVDLDRPAATTYEFPDPGNRREAIATSWETLKAEPLLGSGPGSLPGTNRGEPFRAHFTPLNVAATLGIPALLALSAMALALWRGRSRPTDIAIWSGLAALALEGLTADIEHYRHTWLALGLAGAVLAQRERES